MVLDIDSSKFSSSKLDISRVNSFINMSSCYTKLLEKSSRNIFSDSTVTDLRTFRIFNRRSRSTGLNFLLQNLPIWHLSELAYPAKGTFFIFFGLLGI